MFKRQLLSVFISALVLNAPAHANDSKLTVGLGAGLSPDYEGSDEYEAMPIGYFRYEGEHVIVQSSGPGVEVDLFKTRQFDFGPIVRYHGGRDDVDDAVVDRLDDVDSTVDGGLFIGSGIPLSALGMDTDTVITGKVTYLHDLIDNGHGGFQVKGSLGSRVMLDEKTALMPSISTSYASEDYNDSMFSVSAAETARTGLATYNADSGFKDVGASVVGTHQFTNHWSGSVIMNYTRLINDAADSPIVDDRGSANQFFTGASINYSF